MIPIVLPEGISYNDVKNLLFSGPFFAVSDNEGVFRKDVENDSESRYSLGRHVSTTIRRGNQFRRIIPVRAWATKRSTKDVVAELKRIRDKGIALQPSPYATGTNAFRKIIEEEGTKHSLPCYECRQDLKDNLVGGRVQDTDRVCSGLWKIDKKAAYLSAFRDMPTGTAHRIVGGWMNRDYYTYFCLCRVFVRNRSMVGSNMSVRKKDRSLLYPTTEGEYTSWLWKEQVQDIVQDGNDVEVLEGWGWEGYTTDGNKWRQYMLQQRAGADNPLENKIWKIIANATIGGFGIGDTWREQIHFESGFGRDALQVIQGVGPSDYVVRERRDSTRPTPIHWAGYTHMLVAREAWRLARLMEDKGIYVAMNTDCVYTREKPSYVPKGYRIERVA